MSWTLLAFKHFWLDFELSPFEVHFVAFLIMTNDGIQWLLERPKFNLWVQFIARGFCCHRLVLCQIAFYFGEVS